MLLQGVAAQGFGTQVHLVNCLVSGHMESCVAAINGGLNIFHIVWPLYNKFVLQAVS
jgi:hypothetical protein